MKAQPHDALVEHGFPGRPDGVIAAVQAGACPQCALDQARDQAGVTRWLAERGPRAHDAPGAVCCPAHTWRLALVARERPTVDDLATLYAHGLERLLHDTRLAMTRLEAPRAVRWLQLPGALAPGWFTERPVCPLCARLTHECGRDERGTAGAELRGWLERQPPEARALIVAQTCGAHRAGEGHMARAEVADAAHARWWLSPGARAQDVAFIRRLLREHDEPRFPDGLCPLCVARAEHERALIAAVAAGESFERVSLTPTPEQIDLPEQPATSIDPHALCARHTTVLRAPGHGVSAGSSAPDVWITLTLAAGAPGALRARTSQDDCPACAILHAWELARIEGLHRAAGGAVLSEPVTAQLVWELDHARYLFCAPHLRTLVRFGPANTTWTALGPSIIRGWADLRDQLRVDHDAERVIPIAAAAMGGLPT